MNEKSPLTLEQRVTRVVAEQLGIAENTITPQSNLVDDLGADSLDSVEVVMAIEEEFECEIPDATARQAATVQDLFGLVRANARGVA